MKVKEKNGAIREVNDSYGMRLIEQGKADVYLEPKEPKPEEKPKPKRKKVTTNGTD